MRYRNVFFLFLAEGYTAFVATVVGLLTARLLSVSDFGAFSAAFAFAQILSVLVDSGMGALVGKKIAREPSEAMADLDAIFTWRLLMALSFTLLCPVLSYFFLPTVKIREMAMILTPSLILLMTTDFVSWIFKGMGRAKWCLILQFGSRTLLLGLCIAALSKEHSLKFLLEAYVSAGVLATTFALYVLAKKAHLVLLTALPKSFFINVLPDIYKLGGIIILSVIFSRMDVMLVAKYCGSQQTGFYSGAARVMDGLRMMPTVALGICLPMFSALHDQPKILRPKFLTVYMFLIVLSMTLSLAGFVWADPLFSHLLGHSYRASVPLFRPLVWSCVLMYTNMLMFALLYALNDHRAPAVAVIAAIVINLILNVALLPHFGAIAAAWSRLASEACVFILQARSLAQTGVVSVRDLVFKPGLLIGTCFAVVLILFRISLPLYWAVAVGGMLLMFTAVYPQWAKPAQT